MYVLALAAATGAAATGAVGQEPLPLDHFDGWESWPLVEPGDLQPRNAGLVPLRIEFEGLFPGPNGFGVPPLDSLTMEMDLRETYFHGAPALWIEWMSKPAPNATNAAPALDALLVDRSSFGLIFRLAASQRGEWTGRYEVVQSRPSGVVQVSVDEDGETSKHVLEASGERFDFATYQFLFPFLDLRAGMGVRLAGYDYLDKSAEVLPATVVGQTTIRDANGDEHDVWQVDVMPAHRATLISFYVTPEPPYFFGWDYRLTRDGSTALKLTLKGWSPT